VSFPNRARFTRCTCLVLTMGLLGIAMPDGQAAEQIPPGRMVPDGQYAPPSPHSYTPPSQYPMAHDGQQPVMADDVGIYANLGMIAPDGSTANEVPLGPCDYLGQGDNCPPMFYVEQQVRVLQRSAVEKFPISFEYDVDSSPPDSLIVSTPIDSGDVGFGGAAGYYMTLGRYLGRDAKNRDHFLEFTYWGLNSWDGTAASGGFRFNDGSGNLIGTLFTPFEITTDFIDSPVGGFNRATEHRAFYRSTINNWEINGRFRRRPGKDRLVLLPTGRWRREAQPGGHLSFLYGLRFMTIPERFEFNSSGRVFNATAGEEFDISGSYRIRTNNDMLGVQIGGDYIHQHGKFHWGFRGKAAGLLNLHNQTSDIESVAAGDPYAAVVINTRLHDANDDIASVVEFGVTAKYMITPTCWVHAAYDLMWIHGLALAPEQLQFDANPVDRLDNEGVSFYHGMTLGLEWTF